MIELFLALTLAQNFEQRGFIETNAIVYPQTAPGDSGRVVDETLFRYESSYKVAPWLDLHGDFDAETDTHRQVEREFGLDWNGQSIERPAFSLRRFSATVHKGRVTAELGRQYIRWGKTDILTPTDRFAPKDYLENPIDPDFLGVIAARATIEAGNGSVDLVWQPIFTPARIPLLNQRWTVIPPEAAGVAIEDLGARYPGRSQFGARWNHIGSGYEYSLSYFDGFNNLPLFQASLDPTTNSVGVQRYYPELRMYGASAAVPLPWFTLKGEGGYFSSTTPDTDQYALYVIQLERQIKEWSLVGGYAGEVLTRAGNPLQFAPDRGFARSFLGRAAWTIDPVRSLAIETAVRAGGSFARFEYSKTYGQHWRATAGIAWLRGDMADFIGQYRRNSYASLAIRYSF
ncbi:MAG: hypothetical protein ACRD30_05805 [Bryobacteraceae bacterium]